MSEYMKTLFWKLTEPNFEAYGSIPIFDMSLVFKISNKVHLLIQIKFISIIKTINNIISTTGWINYTVNYVSKTILWQSH